MERGRKRKNFIHRLHRFHREKKRIMTKRRSEGESGRKKKDKNEK